MLAVVGTAPDPDLPLIEGEVGWLGDELVVDGRRVPVNRGTPALLAAALKTSESVGGPAVYAYLAGDVGLGDGSRRLYEHLVNCLFAARHGVMTFHYLQPDVDWHNRVLFAVGDMRRRPVLIADAGFMYAAKMSGQAGEYDLFTPDVGELAFLADEAAPHPFYTRGFILHEDNQAPDLIERAYRYDNAARLLLVKGQPDILARAEGVLARIGEPVVEAMEAVGGTGDTLTGIVSALAGAGWDLEKAAVAAARANRLAGQLAATTPATRILDIITYIP
ncbi:MAG: sugar kinase, partial [Proteobacteria bacterium]|nr:sugar kinase [Pseudomonadota bacterium]